MGGQTEGLACTDLGARTPIGVSGNCSLTWLNRRENLFFIMWVAKLGRIINKIRNMCIRRNLFQIFCKWVAKLS